MKPWSVRARMMLWNVGVLAFVLAALGLVLRFSVQRNLLASVDRDLAVRARPLLLRWVAEAPNAYDGRRQQRVRREERVVIHRMEDRLPAVIPPLPPLQPATIPLRLKPPGPAVTSPLPPRLLTLEKHDVLTRAPREPWDPRAFTRAARRAETIHSTVTVHGEPVRVLSTPLRSAPDGPVDGVVQIAYPLTTIHQEIERLSGTLLTLAPLALLVAGVGGGFLTSRALRPVREMTLATSRLQAEDLSHSGARLPVSGADEFATLSQSFNGMLDRLEEAFAEREAALEQQRRFTADASHELKTPLAIIKAHTSLALQDDSCSPAELRQTLEAVDRAVDRTTRLVQDLLLLARADEGRLAGEAKPTLLSDVLQQALDAVCRPDQQRPQICLDLGEGPPPRVVGNTAELARLFSNLLDNALRHTSAGGEIHIVARLSEDNRSVVTTISDTGEGIAPEHLPHLGERFYRVDAARTRSSGGTGLGLAICKSIAQAHGGSLSLDSVVGLGTVVRVLLPSTSAVPATGTER